MATSTKEKQETLPEKGLVIGPKWADLIVSGEKSWELRKRHTNIRGTIGIIAQGTGRVVGTVEITHCIGPLSQEELMQNKSLTGETEEEILQDIKDGYVYAWVVEKPVKFDKPVPYAHPSGAVTWVNLANQKSKNSVLQVSSSPKRKSHFSQKIFDKRDLAVRSEVWHRIEQGTLFNIFYDTETTDLDKRFAQVVQFGGVITDLAGNPLHSAEYKGKRTDYGVESPEARIITRTRNADLYKGDPPYILAGKIMQFFRHVSNLFEAPFAKSFLQMCRYTGPKGDYDGYYGYPLLDDEGKVDWDSVRIHEGLKKYSYHDRERGIWIKRDIAAMSIGYNNVNADDQWLWTLLHMAAAENIFITHLPQMGKYRLDGLRVVEAAVAAGPKGEHGIQPAYKTDPVTGKKHPSFSQGDILEANTRIASDLRGILEGIKLPDGSYPDLDQLHGAYKDAVALAGLMKYLRRQTPDILRQMENNTDWKKVVDALREKKGGFGNHPILSYVDKSFPYLSGCMVTLIGTDQYRHNPKTAIVFNLGVDPRTFRFNGKVLKDLTPEEHAHLINASRQDQNGVYKIIRTHQSPRLLAAETGFAAGFNNGLEMPELHARAKFLRDEGFINDVMAGLRIAQPRLHGAERECLPQVEEELFTFATLEMYDPKAGEDVQIHRVQNHIERLAQDSRHHAMQVKKIWLKAIEPDEDILLGDFSKDKEGEVAATKKFKDKIKDLNKKLEENNGPLLPEPDDTIEGKEAARKYKLKLLFYARNHFATGAIQDIGHHFWFEDAHGCRIEEADIKSWPQWRIDQASKTGNLNIRHERLNVTAPIIDRIIESLGYASILGARVEKQLQAQKLLRLHGIPYLNGNDRFLTIDAAHKRTLRILNNELNGEDIKAMEHRSPGLWSILIPKSQDVQTILGEYLEYLDDLERRYPSFTPMDQVRAGLDPRTGVPIEKIDYTIAADRAFSLPVPDRYLEDPPLDPETKRPLWLIPLSGEFNRKAIGEAVRKGHEMILTGQVTGRRWHLPKAALKTLPPREGTYEDFYKKAKARFNESGTALPSESALAALTGEGPYAVHSLRGIDLKVPSLVIPKRHFEGLIDHKLASYPVPLTGIIMRDDVLQISEGRVRLLEEDTEGGKPSGWEVESKITKAQLFSVNQIKQFSNDRARRYGFSTVDEMVNHVTTIFADKKLKPSDPENKVWVIDFGTIDAFDPDKGMAYFNPEVIKISAMQIDYVSIAQNMELAT